MPDLGVYNLTTLTGEGLETRTEDDTTCCYAVQDKVWVHGPGKEPWEVYTVKTDAENLARAGDSGCCTPGAGERPETAADGAATASACC